MSVKNLAIPFRYDIVGSFLRPVALKEARQQYATGTITKEDLTKVEDSEISRLIEKQKELGLHAVTDGEFRRRWWHLDFIGALDGLTVYDFVTKNSFNGLVVEAQNAYVSAPITFPANHPALNEFRFAKKCAGDDVLVKQTFPGPNMIYRDNLLLSPQYKENPIYTNFEAFKKDAVKVYQDAIQAFYDEGCRYLQMDDTAWGTLFSEKHCKQLVDLGYDPQLILKQFGELTREAIAKKPADLHLAFHMCRGNFMSSWMYEGAYDAIAQELLAIEGFDGFFLEYDDERSGDFTALKHLKKQRIVLGLITSKRPQLEQEEEIIARIKEATKVVPLEQLCLSPQCGFSSTQEGNHLTEEEQWEKIKLVKRIAERVWEDA